MMSRRLYRTRKMATAERIGVALATEKKLKAKAAKDKAKEAQDGKPNRAAAVIATALISDDATAPANEGEPLPVQTTEQASGDAPSGD